MITSLMPIINGEYPITSCRILREYEFGSHEKRNYKVILFEVDSNEEDLNIFTIDTTDSFDVLSNYVNISDGHSIPRTIHLKPEHIRFFEAYIKNNVRGKYDDLLSKNSDKQES